MSRLEELLNKYCPDGVEYKQIKDIAEINRGIIISKKYIEENKGDYPVYSSQTENNGELGRINNYAYDGEYLTWTTDGANAGSVFYRNEKFNITNVCGLIKITEDNVITKFVYYILHIYAPKYVNRGMGNCKLMSNVMESISIPIPPIEVQKEIVRILDTFTKYQDLLNRELTLRKKQYEYYRDKLLTFDNNIEFKSLSECILNTNNIKWNISQDKKFKYIDLSSVSRENNQILECQVIDYETAPSRAQQIVIKDDVIFGTTRPMLKRMCIIPKTYDNQICSTGFCVLRANKQIVLPKWILYCISTKDFFIYVDKNQKGASYPAILDKEVKKYKIPVPSLEEQKRIVKILDQFDTLCNDITRGLPAEIEMRKKQYEYYRDKLLTFEEKKK